MPSRRVIVRKNLTILKQAQAISQPIDDVLVKQVCGRSFAQLACSLKTYTMSPEEIKGCVSLSYDTAFQETLKTGAGAILCLAHMGNWEILSKIDHLLPTHTQKIGAVYRPSKNKQIDHYIATERQRQGCQMLPKSTSVNTLAQFVREDGILGILADQRAGGAKSERPFFGVTTARSRLPSLLQKRTNAPLFGCSVSSPTPGHWDIHVHTIPTSESVKDSVDLVTKHYESIFSEHLLDVFWLHDYWKYANKNT